MGKKKFQTIIVLVILVGALIFSQSFFDDKFKNVALIDNEISGFQRYQGEGYSFCIPDNWNIVEKGTALGYFSYNGEFQDNNNNIIGGIQIINTKEDVKILAQNHMGNMGIVHDTEKVDNYKNGKYSGIVLEYTSTIPEGNAYVNNIYYIRLDDEKVAKYTFSVKKDAYKDNQKVIFDAIISRLEEN